MSNPVKAANETLALHGAHTCGILMLLCLNGREYKLVSSEERLISGKGSLINCEESLIGSKGKISLARADTRADAAPIIINKHNIKEKDFSET